MSPKLPIHLREKTPYLVGEWLIWADSENYASLVYHEIDLWERVRPGLCAGVFRHMDTKTLQFSSSHYVRVEDFDRQEVWEAAP